jgi:hypothetical protein
MIYSESKNDLLLDQEWPRPFKHSGNESDTLFEQRLVAKGLKALELVGTELVLSDFQGLL